MFVLAVAAVAALLPSGQQMPTAATAAGGTICVCAAREAVCPQTLARNQMEKENAELWRSLNGVVNASVSNASASAHWIDTPQLELRMVAAAAFQCGHVAAGEEAAGSGPSAGSSTALSDSSAYFAICHCGISWRTRRAFDTHARFCRPQQAFIAQLAGPDGGGGADTCTSCDADSSAHYTVDTELFRENTRGSMGSILADYKYTHHLPVSTIQRFVDDTRSTLTRQVVPELARQLNAHPGISISDSVDLVEIATACCDIFAGLESDARRDAWLKQQVDHVKPTLRLLGEHQLASTSDEGFCYGTSKTVKDYCADIPIPETLRRLLQHDRRAWQEVLATYNTWSVTPPNAGTSHVVYADMHSGAVIQNHPELGAAADKSDGAVRIGLIISYDGVTMVNALGAVATKHQVGIISYAIANLPAALRMSLQYIQVACVFDVHDLKRYGADAIMSGPRGTVQGGTSPGAGLRLLDKGMTIGLRWPTAQGSQLQLTLIRTWCVCFAGDFPAVAAFTGFKGSVAAHCFCRQCGLNSEHAGYGLPNSFMLGNGHFRHWYQLRDLAEHYRQFQHWQTLPTAAAQDRYLTSIGVTTFYHGFMRVPHFNICTMCPQDIMHGIYEGVAKLELAAMIYMFVTHFRYFSLETLNRRIATYDWGSDTRPPAITESVIKGTREKTPYPACHVHMTAGQVKTFVAHSIALLCPLLAVTGGLQSAVWACWESFARVVAYIERPTFTYEDILQLDRYIYYWQARFVRIPQYADLWKPKHHFITHIPMDILFFGPPRGYWCMRFEALYQILKAFAQGSNYRQLYFRIAEFWKLKSERDLHSGVTHSWGTTVVDLSDDFISYQHGDDMLMDMLFSLPEFCTAESLSASMSAIVYYLNYRYTTGMWIVVAPCDYSTEPQLAQIGRIVSVTSTAIFIEYFTFGLGMSTLANVRVGATDNVLLSHSLISMLAPTREVSALNRLIITPMRQEAYMEEGSGNFLLKPDL